MRMLQSRRCQMGGQLIGTKPMAATQKEYFDPGENPGMLSPNHQSGRRAAGPRHQSLFDPEGNPWDAFLPPVGACWFTVENHEAANSSLPALDLALQD
jgi:hypothetical protein